MGSQDNKKTLQRFDRLVEACKAEELDEICTPDMTNHALASHRTEGLEGTKEFLRECRGDPDKSAWMHRMMGQHDLVTIAEGDYVIQFGKITATWPGRRPRVRDPRRRLRVQRGLHVPLPGRAGRRTLGRPRRPRDDQAAVWDPRPGRRLTTGLRPPALH